MNGSAFQVNRCKGAQLYLHDHVAQTTVDNCRDSEIMLGPNHSSIFLRNCENCTFVLFC